LGTIQSVNTTSGTQTYSLAVTTTTQTQNYLSVTFEPGSTGSIQGVSWLQDGYDCNQAGMTTPCLDFGTTSWTCLIDTCQLVSGTYDFIVTSTAPVYQITPTLFSVNPFALNQGTVQDSVTAGSYNYYTYIINPSDLLLGQTLSVSVQTISCSGSVSIYFGQGTPAGIDCGQTCSTSGSSNNPCTFSVTSCSNTEPVVGTWYLSVKGKNQDFEAFNVPIQYSITISTSVAAANPTYITLNEVYTVNASAPLTYVLPLDGTFGIGVYQAEITGDSGSLTASFQAPTTCEILNSYPTCNITNDQGSCSISLDGCYQIGYLYLQTSNTDGLNGTDFLSFFSVSLYISHSLLLQF
jgi:hypothetical protein